MAEIEIEIVAAAVAAWLAACHLLVPHLHRALQGAQREAVSFAGGLAVAYVFLHLLPELDATHVALGERIYVVILAGFLVFFGLELGLLARDRHARSGGSFALRLALAAAYSLVLAFTLIEQLPGNLALVVLFALAMSLHLAGSGVGLLERFDASHRSVGRYVLGGAILAGFALSQFVAPSEQVTDIVIAAIAGIMIYRVFSEELERVSVATFGWFAGGSLCMGTLHLLVAGG